MQIFQCYIQKDSKAISAACSSLRLELESKLWYKCLSIQIVIPIFRHIGWWLSKHKVWNLDLDGATLGIFCTNICVNPHPLGNINQVIQTYHITWTQISWTKKYNSRSTAPFCNRKTAETQCFLFMTQFQLSKFSWYNNFNENHENFKHENPKLINWKAKTRINF